MGWSTEWAKWRSSKGEKLAKVPWPTFPIWLKCSLSKASALFRLLSMFELIGARKAIIPHFPYD